MSLNKKPQRIGIIGAGIAGAAAADCFKQHNIETVIFDKGRGPGGRCATRLSRQHTGIERTINGWQIVTEAGVLNDLFDQLVLTAPAPQLPALLGPHFPRARAAAEQAQMLPCWTLMLACDQRVNLPFDAAKVKTDSPLGWLARNTNKPGRAPAPGSSDSGRSSNTNTSAEQPECWVLQANHPWSQTHLDRPPEEVADALLLAFNDLAAEHAVQLPTPQFTKAHRWRYALATPQTPTPSLIDETAGLAVAGDWLAGGKIEAAWLSGRAAAEALMKTMAT